MRRAALAVVVLAACGAKQDTSKRHAQAGDGFQCKNRSVSYVAAHHLGGDEIGMLMDCASNGPQIKRWRVDGGDRREEAKSLTPGEFEGVWGQVSATGWENLKGDCTNGNGGKEAPYYQFDVHDDQSTSSFACQALQLPMPYRNITQPLDGLAAAGFTR